MPTLALIAYLVFLVVAFGWRTWRQYRETGESGWRGLSGGAVARTASLLFVTGLVLALLAPILEWIGWVAPLPTLSTPLAHAFGIAAFAGGFALTTVAQVQMGASWRIGVAPGERTPLVTHGVFHLVRNPIFTGMLLALLGLVLLVPNRLAAIAALATIVGLELQVRFVEEPYLLRTHGEGYRVYARSVGRFVPGLGRLAHVRARRPVTRRLLRAAAVALAAGAALVLAHLAVIEVGREVVVLRTPLPDGTWQETRLWIVDDEHGAAWLHSGGAGWVRRFEADPVVELQRAGRLLHYRARAMPGPHAEIDALLREKYGLADRWVRFLAPCDDDTVPVRLERTDQRSQQE